MKNIKINLIFLVIVFTSLKGLSQNYWLESFSNEGVRLNGKPIHPPINPNDPPITCTLDDVIELRDEMSDCKIGRMRKGPSWIGICCCKNRKITIKNAFRISDKHFQNPIFHQKDSSPIKTNVFRGKGNDKKTNQFLFYRYLADRPTIDSITKYDLIQDIYNSDTLVLFRIENDENGCRLVAENKGIESHFVVYVTESRYSITRMPLVSIGKNRIEELCIVGSVPQTFYVFYSHQYDPVWDCLSDDGEIKCYKIVHK